MEAIPSGSETPYPTQEEIRKQLAKTRPGTEIKFENGRVLGLLEMMKDEKTWAVLAYENEVEFNLKNQVCWRGWMI